MRWHGSGSVQLDDGSRRAGRVGTDSWGRKRLYVGIGGLAASNESDLAIQTMALGSCVGLMTYDPRLQVFGMAHIALPDSAYDGDRASAEPGRYADTAVPALLAVMARFGCDPAGRNLRICLAGGASILGDAGLFDIGRRNAEAMRAALDRLGLRAQAEDLGGTFSRTVVIDHQGRILLSSPARDPWSL